MLNTLDILPCIYLHVKYFSSTNTYTYLSVNHYYANLFNLDNTYFINKDVGFLDSISISSYNDVSILVFLTYLTNKPVFQYSVNLEQTQNHITKNINDTISLILFGKTIESNDDYSEFIIIGFKDTNICNSTSEPTLDRILNNLPIYIYWKDTNGKYIGSNHSLAPYLVFDEPIFTSLIINSTAISYSKYCDNLILESKQPLLNIVETHLIVPEGKRIHFKANKIPITIRGFIIAILYTYEDVTEYIEKINSLNETKELLHLKEQQYQELLNKVNNNTNTDTYINNLFNNLATKNTNSEKELLQLEILLNKIEEQVNILYEKVYTSDNSVISELSSLKENQAQDLRNFNINRIHIDELENKIQTINNSISFLLFLKNLTSKQILLILLSFSLLLTFVNGKINNTFLKKVIDTVEKVI